MTRIAEQAVRTVCRAAVRRVDLRVEGLRHLPRDGPVVLAARHFHHFWDGCALVAVAPRPLHIVVALDWLENPLGRHGMELACRAVGWPVVSRPDHPSRDLGPHGMASDVARLRSATRASVDLLRAGRALLVFPEGYPNIDPSYTPKTDDAGFLPFRAGFLRFVALAQRAGVAPVPIVPVGLDYQRGERWLLTIRFGNPMVLASGEEGASRLRKIEAEVRRLSHGESRPLRDRAPPDARTTMGPSGF